MDPRLRNRGWLKLGIGALFFVGMGVFMALKRESFDARHVSENEKMLGVLWYLVILVFGIWGSIDLAKAKGHGSEVVAFIVVVGCCCPIFYLVMPLIILFALDDKMSRRRRHRH